MKPLFTHVHRILQSRPARAGIVVSAILLIFFLVFDWDWFRAPLIRYVSEKSHRTITASHLDIDFSWSLQPTIKLRDLHIQNAPWSTLESSQATNQTSGKQPNPRPLIAVREIEFTFASFGMLFADKRIVTLISMSEGEVNLERLEDGLRNWRLLNPEYTGPGKYIVLALKAKQSTVRSNDHVTQLNVTAIASPAPMNTSTAALAENDGSPPENTIEFYGSYRRQPFKGQAIAGQTLTIQRTGKTFPIDVQATSGKTSISVSGNIGDILVDQIIDADIKAAGASLSSLNGWMNIHMPPSNAFEAQAHVVKDGNATLVSRIKSKLGKTDINGELEYVHVAKSEQGDKKRPTLNGSLISKQVYLDDIPSMTKAGDPESKRSPDKASPARKTAQTLSRGRLFSASPIPVDSLQSINLHLALAAGQLIAKGYPALDNIKASVALDNGILQLDPAQATMAGGAIDGRLTLNGDKTPAAASIKVNLDKLPADRLLAIFGKPGMLAVPLSMHTELKGNGDSLAAILGDATGDVQIRLGQGSISNKLDAKLGLDAGKILWLSIRGDKAVSLHCGVMLLEFERGIGTARKMSLDTAQTYLDGTGKVNLRDETLSFMLIPRPKDPSLFSIDSAIQVDGKLRQPKIALNRHAANKKSSSSDNASPESGC